MKSDRNKIFVEFIPPQHWHKPARWKLLREFTSLNSEITVPRGFVSNGANIPVILRWLFSPTGKYFGAAIVHDYLLSIPNNWVEANYQFGEHLKLLGVGKTRIAILRTGVNLYYRWLRISGQD